MLAQSWQSIQTSLFPWLSEELGELTAKQQELITTLEIIRIEEFIISSYGYPGRPPEDRGAIAKAFVAKMVYNMPTTRVLLDRLKQIFHSDEFVAGNEKVTFPRNGLFREPLLNFLIRNCPNVYTKAL